MSRYRLEDDFFSPVRFDTSNIGESNDSSEESLNDLSNADEFSLTDIGKNEINLEKNVRKSDKTNEIKCKGPESTSTCTSVLSQNSSDKSNSRRNSSKLKLEKIKENKIVAEKKKHFESKQRKQESSYRGTKIDSDIAKDSDTKHYSLEYINKKQKGNKESSKCDYVHKAQKSSIKESIEKKVIDSPNLIQHNRDIKSKDSSKMSVESKGSSTSNSEYKKSNSAQMGKKTANPSHSSYKASIEKMIRSSISSEAAKIRQHMYLQQMSFYKEMNKINDKIEQQHLATTERLFTVIQELMQMNASLRLALSNKD